MNDQSICVVFAVGCLTAIEITALLTGHNSVMFGGVVTAVGVLVGYMFGVRKKVVEAMSNIP